MNIVQIFPFLPSAAKSVLGDLLLSDLRVSMEKNTTIKVLLTHLICIHLHILGYKIKSVTLPKHIYFTEQTRIKLTVSSPSEAATHSLP